MTTTFPTAAANRFNERGCELLACLREIGGQPRGGAQERFAPDLVPVLTLVEAQIQEFSSMEQHNPLTGERISVYFDDGAKLYELDGEGCQALDSLAAAILKSSGISSKVTLRWIDGEIKKWINPQDEVREPLADHILRSLNAAVRRYTVCVPIANLYVQSEFVFGGASFKPITAEMLSVWEAKYHEGNSVDTKNIGQYFGGIRRKYQGLAALSLEVEAEASKAIETAVVVAERSTALLRTLCVENLHPRACSYCLPQGRYAAVSDDVWLSVDSVSYSTTHNLLSPFPVPWEISSAHLLELEEFGLSQLSEIASPGGSEFDQKLVEALLIYNRANVSRDPVDKLIFILVSLESMLLKNQLEPIQASVGDRLAFAVGKDADERMKIVTLLREVYAIRSRYIHHGEGKEDIEAMRQFMTYAWAFFTWLVKAHGDFPTKEALIGSLDRRKYQ